MKKSKPIVIHIVHNLQIGGVETAVRSSIDYLNNHFDFWVVTLHPNNKQFLESVKLQKQIKCFNLHSIWAPINLIKLIWFILNINPTLIITSLWKSYAVCNLIRLFNKRVPIIPIIHNSKFFHAFDKYFTRKVVNQAPIVLCDSNSSKEFILSECSFLNAQVVSFKIDQDEAISNTQNFNNLDLVRAVFIGRLSGFKRVDRALALIKLLIEKGVNIQFDVYGPDHNTQNNLMQLAKTLNIKVMFNGAIPPDEVVNKLVNYHFFIQLSDVEGMAITVVQAMQQGVIPIVTKVGEMQYYVKNMDNGIVVSPPFDDLETTANAIVDLLKLPIKLQQMSEQAKVSFINQPLYAHHMHQLIKQQLGA